MDGVVLAATRSGAGKTVATLSVIRALRAQGRDVRAPKATTDFIEPSHHETVVEGRPRTLDPWLQGEDGLVRNYHRADGDARFAFDGERGTGIDGDREGLTEHRTLGTYCHVHPARGPFDRFLEVIG